MNTKEYLEKLFPDEVVPECVNLLSRELPTKEIIEKGLKLEDKARVCRER